MQESDGWVCFNCYTFFYLLVKNDDPVSGSLGIAELLFPLHPEMIAKVSHILRRIEKDRFNFASGRKKDLFSLLQRFVSGAFSLWCIKTDPWMFQGCRLWKKVLLYASQLKARG